MDKTMRGYRQIPVYLKYLINTLLLVALLVVGNHLISSGAVNRAQSAVILQIGIYALRAVSLNVATGYLGQLPLGHAGFMAVGAYTAALIWKALPGKSLGGSPYGKQGGILDDTRTGKASKGTNNIGLLVRTTGKVVKRGSNYFYIDDGSRLFDGTNNGIYVKTKSGITVPQLNRRVSVTGISACEEIPGGNRRILLVRRAADIRTL